MQDSKSLTGNFFVDEEVLRNAGVSDFAEYAMNPDVKPPQDFFLD
jgi:citronellol/citronellal dehydrogenase